MIESSESPPFWPQSLCTPPPDEIDMIIEAGLGLIGAKKIVLPNLKK